ncbi:hypothetical protein BG004_004472 [Podila humilis]|nr:hypothetical protein BG004_004472 [Podila humilis]
MHKSVHILSLLLALFALGVYAARTRWYISITNNAGKTTKYPVSGRRHCVCLKTTQTRKITNTDAGQVKLFKTWNCLGSYTVLPLGQTQNSANWVNSMSVGEAGIPSTGPNDCTSAD